MTYVLFVLLLAIYADGDLGLHSGAHILNILLHCICISFVCNALLPFKRGCCSPMHYLHLRLINATSHHTFFSNFILYM